MNKISISSLNSDFNKIESFVEEVCDKLNLHEKFHGNILIAITEVINYVESYNQAGELSFHSSPEEVIFDYKIKSKSASLNNVLNPDFNVVDIFSEGGKGIFMIMSLCDDMRYDYENNILSIVFKIRNIGNVITDHRKQYLKNYLGKTVGKLR